MTTLLNILNTRLAEPARWIVVGLIAYTLATSALYFISPPQSEPVAGTQTTASDPRPQATNINDIVSRNLFGRTDASNEPIRSTAAAVETRLPLELHGVFVAETPTDSAAIIAQKGKPGILYSIGQALPGNAELLEVHPDHIVLRRAGVRETLTFPEITAQLIAQRAGQSTLDAGGSDMSNLARTPNANRGRRIGRRSRGAASAGPSATTAREFVSNYRELIEDDPQAALSGLGVTPVTQGASSGYRLGSLADSPYLSQTGLQPGDVILSVNGRPVGDIAQDRMQIDNVLTQGSARLEVQRGTRRFFVTASLR